MTVFSIQSALDVPAERLHQAFTDAFSDYLIGPFQISLAQWPGLLARQGADLALSRVAVDAKGAVLAFALVAPRPHLQRWRLASMGAVPAARGCGAAAALLEDFSSRAQAAGCSGIELEVFAQNDRARRLYERHGFELVDELHGYVGCPTAEIHAQAAHLQPLAWADALAWLDEAESQGLALPLQQTRLALAVAQGQQAWRLGTAMLTGAPRPDDPTIFLLGAVVDRQPTQQDLQRLVAALAAHHAEWRQWQMPQILRPSVGGEALTRLGLQRQPLHQHWVQRRF